LPQQNIVPDEQSAAQLTNLQLRALIFHVRGKFRLPLPFQ
jgi:hypothetical protein